MSAVLRFAVVGHPVRTSASPAMHRAAFQALGMPHFYDAMDCPDRASLETAVQSLRRGILSGLNITVPHKRIAIELADSLDESASFAGVANTLVRDAAGDIVAHNTDLPALEEEIAALTQARATALVIGAGGAAFAAVSACKRLGFRVIAVTTRSFTTSDRLYEDPRAEGLRERGALVFPWPEAPAMHRSSAQSGALRHQLRDLSASADIIIQAAHAGPGTADGGVNVALAIGWENVPKSAVALDVVYGPYATPFISSAREVGLKVADGVGMLVRQGARSFKLWLGEEPPRPALEDAVRKHLAFAR